MKHLFKFSVLLLVMVACSRDKKDFLGPAYISAPEGFGVTSFTTSAATVNFTSGTIQFNSTFTSAVTWVLTITGEQSGAVHQIKGISNGFTNLTWTGNHDEVYFFRSGETAVATLSFFGTTYTSSVSFQITTAPDYTTCGRFANDADFENPAMITHANGWHAFDDPTPIPNVDQGVGTAEIDYTGKVVPSVQGTRYYYIRGLGNQNVFVSGIQNTDIIMPLLPANPDSVWVNMFIYGTGDPNAGVELEYQEEDADGSAFGYQGTDDDAFVAKFTLEHTGWKLFSFKYSDLVPSLNLPFGGSGNHIHEPHRLQSFDLVLVKKTDPNSPIEVYFDYPIITVGGPFKPCK